MPSTQQSKPAYLHCTWGTFQLLSFFPFSAASSISHYKMYAEFTVQLTSNLDATKLLTRCCYSDFDGVVKCACAASTYTSMHTVAFQTN